MMRSGLSEHATHFLHRPHPRLSVAAEGFAEIVLGIVLLVGLALVSVALWLALTAVGAVGWG